MMRTQKASFEVRAALSLIGFSAVLGQVVLMRELMVLFNGTELCVGIALAIWLLWTATGSVFASYFVRGFANIRKVVAWSECLAGLSLPPTIWMLRFSKAFLQTVPGELVGLVPMFVTSLLCFSVFCILSGFLFVVTARLFRQECGVSDHLAISSAYLFESVGSGLGGILASLIMLRYLVSFQIAIVVALLNVCMALWLLLKREMERMVAALAVLALALPLIISWAPYLDRSIQQRLWRGFRIVAMQESIYGSLAILESDGLRGIYDNGMLLTSVPDQNAAEESVHYALLEHPEPRRVLLIGGGVNGSVAEVLKHPALARLDYVELDPSLIHLAQQFFPEQTRSSFSDPRVHIHSVDGRHYLRTTSGEFDAILLNLPEPQTAQLNRFYTVEFFRLAREHLATGGILAVQLPASEDYLSPGRQEFLRCIHGTLRQVFPYVTILPGGNLHLFAAGQPNILTENAGELVDRLQRRNLQAQYVREYFIPFRMMPDRMAEAKERLQPLPSTPINRDFLPIAYYFDIVLWSMQFNPGSSSLFQTVAHVAFRPFFVSILLLCMVVVIALRYLPLRQRRCQLLAVSFIAATGFTLMALQIVLLLAFQAVYGYVYYQLAILIGMFMAGLAAGSWLRIRFVPAKAGKFAMRAAIRTQCFLAISLPASLVLILMLSQVSGSVGTLFSTQLAFPILAILCGLMGGYQFPVVTEIYLGDSKHSTTAAVLYAVDLLGGCLGALFLGTYLLPVFGFWKTAWFTAAINVVPILAAFGSERRGNPVRG